ncbi:hypothetical protein PVAP13_9KG615501 [Panicum virgatum]|uniref:Uncharacterized protein n=1 Tax=Panicum virgatum TaxID=38727 RepID=A0A8T0NY61_PANVG|nr:hypothetical protein PVAP13_9KG615501 [Panicum virgatum]
MSFYGLTPWCIVSIDPPLVPRRWPPAPHHRSPVRRWQRWRAGAARHPLLGASGMCSN